MALEFDAELFGKPEAFFEKHEKGFTHPSVINESLKILRNPTCSAESLSVFLERDPGLSSRILKLANSALFGTPKAISSLKAAIIRLGNQNIARLVLALSLTSKAGAAKPQWQRFWKHSVSVAMLSRHIAQFLNKYNRQEQDEFFSMGLLHDLGLLIELASGSLEPVFKRIEKDACGILVAEREILGFDHCQLGAVIAERWNFPGDLRNAITCHHDPDNSGDFIQKVIVIHLANLICHGFKVNICAGENPPETKERYLEIVQLPVEQLIIFGSWLSDQQESIDAFGSAMIG